MRCSNTAKHSSVSQKAPTIRHGSGQVLVTGCTVALYSAWRRLTTKVVSQITGSAAPPPIRLIEMNCAEPAKTIAESASAISGGSPAETTSVPKMMANGVVPTVRGIVSRKPAKAAESGVDIPARIAKTRSPVSPSSRNRRPAGGRSGIFRALLSGASSVIAVQRNIEPFAQGRSSAG